EVEGLPSPATIRRVRKKLRLSQREAGSLLKVGESAFDKYERGLVEPSGPTSQLLRLLDRHPELAEELEAKIMEALKSGEASGSSKKPKLKKASEEKEDTAKEEELDDISDSEFPDDFSIEEDVTED
ncbi:MAG: type II toxin-antitoxin system MqsA family antitoxin, partial [Muribaculum sp.]|nr:type II toxin-antitoxin system MqsA family antitoxin [Muribaculum sp.]